MKKRIFEIVKNSNQGKIITYVMTKAFRVRNNYALDFLVDSNKEDIRIVICHEFFESDRINDFCRENITDLKDKLNLFASEIKQVEHIEDALEILKSSDIIITDKAYLKRDKHVLDKMKHIAFQNNISLSEVSNNVVIPVETVSNKEEYGARTIRPKILSKLGGYLEEVMMDYQSSKGEIKAQEALDEFITTNLNHYNERNDPSLDYTSHLSKYLKYGFISPVQIVNQVHASQKNNQDLFIEELVVRRELAINFCYYNEGYDQFDQMTYDWAYKTMKVHEMDEKEYIYTTEDYLAFKTHDRYFNAAMKEMVYFGYMHNYMRMYWAKKIIEWSYTYKEAFEITLFLNNTYFYDGNTPNGYTGVAWCYGKHDRAWPERKIFGKLRYMNSNGLKRKFDIETYVSQIEEKVAMLDE